MTYREDSDFVVPYGLIAEDMGRFENGETIYGKRELQKAFVSRMKK